MSAKLMIAGLVAALALAGCSSSRVANGLDTQPQQVNVATNNPLALPPDLSLRAPGSAQAYAPAAPSAPIANAPLKTLPATPGTAAPQQDVYAQYGVSKVNPDGTPKTQEQLQAELKAAVLKRKKQQNPNYGTIRNFGNIFSDG